MEQQDLNPTLVYILAILGLLCCCVVGLGFIPAGIAFYIAHNKLTAAKLAPENYGNVSAMKTAKTVALIILIINILYFLRSMYVIYTLGWDEIMERSRQLMEQYGFDQAAAN